MFAIEFFRPKLFVGALVFTFALYLSSICATANADQGVYFVSGRDANQTIWNTTVAYTNGDGQIYYRTNSYTEIATGLNHLVGDQWVPSSDDIQITPSGGTATNTQHQVAFAANINTVGSIDLTTPRGRHLTGTVLGLSFYDTASSNSVIIAELQDSIGQILPSGNQVIYTNALVAAQSDFQADVLYTHTRNSFAQDIILHQQPPDPAAIGLNPDTTMIQVWTKFFSSPEPQISSNTIQMSFRQQGGMHQQICTSENLNFGSMEMDRGSAYSTGHSGTPDGNLLIPVAKHWVWQNGQRFLVEEVPFNAVVAQLNTLPPTTPNGSGSGASGSQQSFFRSPPATTKEAKLQSLRLAKKGRPVQPGLVMDYNLINSSLTNFTFQSDTTYYITNEVDLYGTTTIEGGTVIKYSKSVFSAPPTGQYDHETTTAGIVVLGTNMVWKTAPYRPAIFTGMDDDSVGQQISGSSGSPGTNYYGHLALDVFNFPGSTISNVRFSHLCACLLDSSETLRDAQVVNCLTLFDGGNAALVGLGDRQTCCNTIENVLLHQVKYIVAGGPDGDGGDTLTVENVTAHNCGVSLQDGTSVINVTNSLFVNFTNWQSLYNNTNHLVVLTNDTGVFHVVGDGSYYLATNSPYRAYGITNIDPLLLADLQQKTTFPPIAYSNVFVSSNLTLFPQAQRDTNASVDIGYHYDPIDFAFGGSDATSNVFINVLPGTTIGCFDITSGGFLTGHGLYLPGIGTGFISQGSPTSLNRIVSINTVQECSTNQWTPLNAYGNMILINNGNPGNVSVNCRFTDFSVLAQDCGVLSGYAPSAGLPMTFKDCQFHGGVIDLLNESLSFINCLHERVLEDIWPDYTRSTDTLTCRNNLWVGGNLSLGFTTTNGSLQDNLFYSNTISGTYASSGYASGYNGYFNSSHLSVTNSTDHFLTTDPGFQAGPLGNYYLPTNSILINVGSTTADLVGLYHYTTQTNQIKETNSPLDIGFHYIAVNSYGQPDDTDGDGLPDYVENQAGDGIYETGDLSNWQVADTDGDGMSDGFEVLVSHTNPKNGDQNSNSIPDGWEWNYFGSLSVSATASYDGSGGTVDYDYQNGIDPNIINFWTYSTNNYFSSSPVPLRVQLEGGVPTSQAFVIDSTNFSAANWTPYTTSNLTVSLGVNQGWHDVWVGLRGMATNATVTWSYKRIKLDSVPPWLVITNPISTSLTIPVAQLGGYCSEALSGLKYSVSNALGVSPALTGYVTDQFYDTNAVDLTTNQFSCGNVLLAVGANIVSLRATDKAGNVMVTNLSFVVDYSTKTNPPIVQLYWPQNGANVSSSTITWRGKVDDVSVSVQGLVLDADGNTNAFDAIVENNGEFWIENLPLLTGANTLTLVATDRAGNISATNISVTSGISQLTINTVYGSWSPTINVSGTIGSGDYTLWVNGTMATINDNGTWSANNIPTPPGGVTVIQARAIPNSDNGGNGTGGGGSLGYNNLGNPQSASADAQDAELQSDKPSRLFCSSDHQDDIEITHNHTDVLGPPGTWHNFQFYDVNWHFSQSWKDGTGGSSDLSIASSDNFMYNGAGSDTSGTSDTTIAWPASYWENLPNGVNTSDGYYDYAPPPVIHLEHANFTVATSTSQAYTSILYSDFGDFPYYNTDEYSYTHTRNAQDTMKLKTGGKSGLDQNQLYAISASITDQIHYDPGIPETTDLVVGSANGSPTIYTTLGNNTTIDVTPSAPGHDYYYYSVGAGVQSVSIFVNGNSIDPQYNPVPPVFCVGQKLIFSDGPDWDVDYNLSAVASNTIYQWTASAIFVNHSSQLSNVTYNDMGEPTTTNYYGSVNYDISSDLLNEESPQLWYLSPGIKNIREAIQFTFSDGQSATLTAKARIKIYEPSINMQPFTAAETNRYYSLWSSNVYSILSLGDNSPYLLGNMDFNVKITSDFWGDANITQLITCSYSNPYYIFSTEKCDGSEFYNGTPTRVYGESTNYVTGNLVDPQPTSINLNDAPRGAWSLGDNVVSLSARDFIRYKPDGVDNIWVTLGIVSWNTVGVAEIILPSPSYSITSQNTPAPSGPVSSTEIPHWTDVIVGAGAKE